LLKGLAALFPSPVDQTMSTIGVYKDTTFANFETDLFAPLSELFSTSTGPLLAIHVRAIRGPVLGLVWLDGRMEDVRSVLDLEVESVELLGDLVNGAKDVLLSNETERTIQIVDNGEVNLLGSHDCGLEMRGRRGWGMVANGTVYVL